MMSNRRYKFFMLLEGTTIITVDQQAHTLNPGDVIFINHQVPYREHYFEGAVHHTIHIVPSPKDSHSLMTRFNSFSLNDKRFIIFSPDTQEGQAIRSCILNICKEAAERQTGYQSFIKAESTRLQALLFRFHILNEPTEHTNDPNFQRLLPVFEYIDAHLAEPLTLSALSQLLHISEGHFCRLFRQTTNISPFGYINHVRIHKAQQLLADHSLSITDISYAVGFSSPPYFDRTFRKYAHVSPNRYRRRLMFED